MVGWEKAYDQLSQKFSPWMPWRGITGCDVMKCPGVYLIAEIGDHSIAPSVVDPRIIYIGETIRQTLLARFIQFEEAARTGCNNRHSGGRKYFARTKGQAITVNQKLLPDDLCISVMPTSFDDPVQSAFIRYTERAAIWYFVRANNRYPDCNSA